MLLAISASSQGFYVGSKTHLRSCDDYFLVCVYPLILYVRAFLLGSFFLVPCKTWTLFLVGTGICSSDPLCIGTFLLKLFLLLNLLFQLCHEQIWWIMSQVSQSFSHWMDPLGGPIIKDKDKIVFQLMDWLRLFIKIKIVLQLRDWLRLFWKAATAASWTFVSTEYLLSLLTCKKTF